MSDNLPTYAEYLEQYRQQHETAMARLAEMGYWLGLNRSRGQWMVWNGRLIPHRKVWVGDTPESAIAAAWEAWQKENVV